MKLPKEVVNITPLSKVVAVIVLIAVALISFGLGATYQEVIDIYKQQQTNLIPTTVTRKISPSPLLLRQITQEEKQRIAQWIIVNNLNQYGDPKGTVYIGGTPLFNEETLVRIDRYAYIVGKHPDRPWNK